MKLDDFQAFVQNHRELEGVSVVLGALETEDRLQVRRRTDGVVVAIAPRLVVELEWRVIEQILLGKSPSPTGPEPVAVSGEGAPWSRSQFGLVKDRLVRSYSVETLLAR